MKRITRDRRLTPEEAAKVAAYNCAVYVNHCVGRPPFALFNPLA